MEHAPELLDDRRAIERDAFLEALAILAVEVHGAGDETRKVGAIRYECDHVGLIDAAVAEVFGESPDLHNQERHTQEEQRGWPSQPEGAASLSEQPENEDSSDHQQQPSRNSPCNGGRAVDQNDGAI